MLPQQIYLANADAYQRMLGEAQRSPGHETGGILVGRTFAVPSGPMLVVVAASGPGAQAERNEDYFAPDVREQQHALDYWRGIYAAYGIDYVGQWHTHPPGSTTLSGGDVRQALAILDDANYALPSGLFTPLLIPEGAQLQLYSYYFPRATRQPQLVPWKILDGSPQTFLDLLLAYEPKER